MGVGLSDEENRKQFAGIVVPHLSEAFAVASWLTGNRTDAEDVVQEACLRAFRAIGSFAGVNARAWVLTIVRHTAIRGSPRIARRRSLPLKTFSARSV